MFKKVVFGGLLASAVTVHLVESKNTKELLKKYCPMLMDKKCCNKKCTKKSDCDK